MISLWMPLSYSGGLHVHRFEISTRVSINRNSLRVAKFRRNLQILRSEHTIYVKLAHDSILVVGWTITVTILAFSKTPISRQAHPCSATHTCTECFMKSMGPLWWAHLLHAGMNKIDKSQFVATCLNSEAIGLILNQPVLLRFIWSLATSRR